MLNGMIIIILIVSLRSIVFVDFYRVCVCEHVILFHFRTYLMRFLCSIRTLTAFRLYRIFHIWSIVVQFISSPGLMSFSLYAFQFIFVFLIVRCLSPKKFNVNFCFFRFEFRHNNNGRGCAWMLCFCKSLSLSKYLCFFPDLLRKIWYLSFPIDDRPAVICDMCRCVSSTNCGNNRRARILYNGTLPGVRHAYRRYVVSMMPSNIAPYHTVDMKTISSANILYKISNT